MGNILQLLAHPNHPPHKVAGVGVDYALDANGLLQIFYVIGAYPAFLNIAALPDRVPMPVPAPVRGEALWEKSCCEIFIRADGAAEYLEYNFSFEHEWAGYSFEAYREGMTPLETPQTLEIGVLRQEKTVAMEVSLSLPEHLRGQTVELGISAIVEEQGGPKSYWALNHPFGKADFHHDTCFALQLTPPVST